jgi:hypothetical protein
MALPAFEAELNREVGFGTGSIGAKAEHHEYAAPRELRAAARELHAAPRDMSAAPREFNASSNH